MTSEERRKRLAQLQSGSVAPVEEVEPEVPLDSSNARRERLKVIQSNNALAREKRLEQDPTAFERIVSEPFGRAVERQQAISERMGEGFRELDFLDRDPMRPYDPSFGTDVPSVLVQTATNPISLGFDMAANALLLGAEEAVSLVLPDEMEEGMKKQMMQFMQTDIGQRAIAAMTSGVEAWESFSRAYPNEAANILGGIDAYFATPSRVIKNFNPDLRPVKVEKIGLRKVDKPMEGIDKDVYNIAYSRPSGKTKEQAKLTTGPEGLLRTQKQLATDDQLAVVDELIAAGVRGNKTLTENLRATNEYLDALDDSLIKMARRKETPPIGPKESPITVRPFRLQQNLNEAIQEMIQQNPAVFESPAAVKRMQSLVKQYMTNLAEEGNTIEGLIKARRKFNSDLERMGADVAGTKLNVNSMGGVAIRRAVNKTIGEEMPESLKINEKMSRILSVQDNMAVKAADEAGNFLGRYIQQLGLDRLVGGTAGSILISGIPALAYSVAVSPIALIRNAMKAEIPARGRAKVKYALRDVKDQFNKALKDLAKRDPQAAKELLAQKAVVYTALDAAAQKLENEYKETVNQDGS
jgi:hypothetical protein